MATKTITIPNAKVQDIIDAFKWKYPKPANVLDADWPWKVISRYVDNIVNDYKKWQAHQTVDTTLSTEKGIITVR